MMYHEIAKRLEAKLGLGQFPLIRRRLYQRLQRLCEQKGDGPLQVIAALVQEAEGPKIRDKGQYFCYVVKRRLEEAGYGFGDQGDTTYGCSVPPNEGRPAKPAAGTAGQPAKTASAVVGDLVQRVAEPVPELPVCPRERMQALRDRAANENREGAL